MEKEKYFESGLCTSPNLYQINALIIPDFLYSVLFILNLFSKKAHWNKKIDKFVILTHFG